MKITIGIGPSVTFLHVIGIGIRIGIGRGVGQCKHTINQLRDHFHPLHPFVAFDIYSAGDCRLTPETNTATGGGTVVTEQIMTEEQCLHYCINKVTYYFGWEKLTYIMVVNWRIQRGARDAPSLGPISFIFMQFSAKHLVN